MNKNEDGGLSRREFIKDSTLAMGAVALGIHLLPQKEAMAMEKTALSLNNIFPDGKIPLQATDPEFAEFFYNFAFAEVRKHGNLDEKTRYMAILATLLGCQGMDAYRLMLPAALAAGLSPAETREIVYQAVAYLGFGRVYPFFNITNEVFKEKGIKLPLAPASTTTPANRREKGNQTQIEIFGENMREFWKKGPEDTGHIRSWLAANCFGDYYTRKGLDLRQRELITFCYIMAQGGCEPQLVGHAQGNMRMGNDKEFLITIVSECLPFIGYPRSLNAIKCIEDAAAAMNK